jgi:crossover junction endodeoxyribonuclease RusA
VPNVTFTVYGCPVPQGSMRAFLPKGSKRPIITSDNPKLKSWRQECAGAAIRACNGHNWPILSGIPIELTVTCFFASPKSRKKNASLWKSTRPDVDKLLRAIGDALTGIAWQDDSQVSHATIAKVFGIPERIEVQIKTLATLLGEV